MSHIRPSRDFGPEHGENGPKQKYAAYPGISTDNLSRQFEIFKRVAAQLKANSQLLIGQEIDPEISQEQLARIILWQQGFPQFFCDMLNIYETTTDTSRPYKNNTLPEPESD